MKLQIPVKRISQIVAIWVCGVSIAVAGEIEPISVKASSDDGNSPQNTLDGSNSTRWSAEGDGEWIQYDLGGTYTVDNLKIAFYKGNSRDATVDIQTSSDARSWNTVFSGEQRNRTDDLQHFEFDDTSGRYVRIVGYGNTSNSWNSLTEVAIYATDGGSSRPTVSTPPTVTPNTPDTPRPPTPRGGDIPQAIYNNFEAEGDDPTRGNALVFDALREQVTTPNGNGWRHELKIPKRNRVGMDETYEYLSADYRIDLSDGGKTIIAQYHASDLGTLAKVYVADTNESGFDDSNDSNGVFDVYVRLRNTSGNEQKYALGTIRSGNTFRLTIENDFGFVTVKALGTTRGLRVEDDSASYLKFGNYLQSQDPDGSRNCGSKGNSSSFANCYRRFGITKSVVTVTNIQYTRRD